MLDADLASTSTDLLDHLAGISPDTHLLQFGANPTAQQLEQALNRNLAGFVRVPIVAEKLRETVARLLQAPPRSGALGPMIANLHTEARERHSMLVRARRSGLLALARLAEHRDSDTGLHLERVSVFAGLLATLLRGNNLYRQEISDDFVSAIRLAAALHDIGKVAVPDTILRKPGKLTPEEFAVMQQHCVKGWEVIEAARQEEGGYDLQLRLASEVVRSHHERWDGTGYPDRLAGMQIPLSARIVAVIDVYDAMRSKRVYSNAQCQDAALAEISQDGGRHFDPAIAPVFVAHAGEFEDLGRSLERITARWT
jgi:putative two-component system response regulator